MGTLEGFPVGGCDFVGTGNGAIVLVGGAVGLRVGTTDGLSAVGFAVGPSRVGDGVGGKLGTGVGTYVGAPEDVQRLGQDGLREAEREVAQMLDAPQSNGSLRIGWMDCAFNGIPPPHGEYITADTIVMYPHFCQMSEIEFKKKNHFVCLFPNIAPPPLPDVGD